MPPDCFLMRSGWFLEKTKNAGTSVIYIYIDLQKSSPELPGVLGDSPEFGNFLEKPTFEFLFRSGFDGKIVLGPVYAAVP